MPARRLPDDQHRKRGSYRTDRGHGASVPPVAPAVGADRVGDPPEYLDAASRAVWQQLSTAGWWLTSTDRAALEVAVLAQVALRNGPTAALISAASKALSDLGLTPRARGAVVGLSPAAPAKKADPLSEWGVTS